MDAKKVCIERELKSKSINIIWPLLSTPEGLAKWIADDVKWKDGVLSFTWGNVWSHHETRTATVLEKNDFKWIRLRWDDDEFADTYWELRMEKSDLTGDVILVITDFATDGDVATIEDIWEPNLESLNRTTGLYWCPLSCRPFIRCFNRQLSA